MKAFLTTWATAWREALANRRGVTTQLTVMITNDIAWIAFWVIFFDRVGHVRGWTTDSVIVLLSILTVSVGLVLGSLANVRYLGQLAVTGGLDATLVLPGSPLRHLLARRIDTIHLGDMLFGVALFAVAGDPTPRRVAIWLGAVVVAAVLVLGFLLLVGSLAFFAGSDDAGYLGFQSILLFSAYPVDIFSGVTKLVLYGVIPAGLVASVPARLVAEFDASLAAALLGAAVGFTAAGLVTFHVGLRRYRSGAAWTRA